MRYTILASILFLCVSCGTTIETIPIEEAEHLQYFGFTIVDTYFDDPTDNVSKTSYVDEVHRFSNVADILVVNPTDDLVEKMSAMSAVDVKAILHLHELFFVFQDSISENSGANYDLRGDYIDRWTTFVSINDLQENQEMVQAFYLGEEPTWNGIGPEELRLAADFIKKGFPDVPIMVIEAYPVIAQLVVPASVDWIGFDHYFVEDPIRDEVFQNEMETLISKFVHSEQRLVLVLDSHYIEWAHGDFGGIKLKEMGDVARSYYELAKRQELTVALIGYCWPSGFDFTESIGARHMPEKIMDEYVRIGKEITGKP